MQKVVREGSVEAMLPPVDAILCAYIFISNQYAA